MLDSFLICDDFVVYVDSVQVPYHVEVVRLGVATDTDRTLLATAQGLDGSTSLS